MDIGRELKSSFTDNIQKAHINILYTAGWLRGKVIRELKPYGLTVEQYNVLRILRGSHPKMLCVKDISCRMIDRNSNTTRIIDKLEQKGLAKRIASREDRRELNVMITPEGLSLLKEIDKSFKVHDPGQCPLPDKDMGELSDLLDKMRSKV